MKDTTSNMVAPLNPLELTAAAQVIRNFIQSDSQLGRGSMDLERRHKQEVHNTTYFMANYHIVSITPPVSLCSVLKTKRNGTERSNCRIPRA